MPGVAHAVNIVGFSGATFTNAPNAGAVFVVLEPFEERAKDPRQIGGAPSRAHCSASSASIQEAVLRRGPPPPVPGIGNAGGFRMMVEDRGGRGSAGAAGRRLAMMGAARARPPAWRRCSRCSRPRRRSSISTSTAPRRSCSASTCPTCSPRCRSISARPMSTTSICSAAPSASWRRPTRRIATTPATCLNIRVRNTYRRDRAARRPSRPCATSPGRTACRATIFIPLPNSTARAAPGFSQGQAIEIMEQLAAQDAAGRLLLRMDDARLPADARRQHRDLRLRARRWCSCSWCWPRSSKA